MKNYSFFLLLLFFLFISSFNSVNAQSDTDRLSDKRRKAMTALCDCFSKIDLSKVTSPRKAEKEIKKCFFEDSTILLDYINTGGYEYSNVQDELSAQWVNIISELMVSCPALKDLMVKSVSNKSQ